MNQNSNTISLNVHDDDDLLRYERDIALCDCGSRHHPTVECQDERDFYGPDWQGLDMGEDDEDFEDTDTFVPMKRRAPKLTDLVGAHGDRDVDNNLVVHGRQLGEVAVLRSTDGKAAQRQRAERKDSRNRRKARR